MIPHYNGEYPTCSKPINWVISRTHTIQPPWLSSQDRNTQISKFYPKLLLQSTLKRWRKKQEMELRFKKGTQIYLYHGLCLYGLRPWAMKTCTEFYSTSPKKSRYVNYKNRSSTIYLQLLLRKSANLQLTQLKMEVWLFSLAWFKSCFRQHLHMLFSYLFLSSEKSIAPTL